MTKIRLISMRIQNFKGIADKAIAFGDVTNILGANATGKSSIMDAFLWLLFNKDSSGRTDFQIRPLDVSGNMIDNIDIIVEARLDIDGVTVLLEKTQKQNWVKRRGSEAPTFSGNVNSYKVDGFPQNQKEFDAKVAEILNEGLFRLLTNPRAFASLKWQEQRAILLKFVSEITDTDVLDLDPGKYDLVSADVLAAGAEKAKEKAWMILRKLKEEQKTFPIRIDEANRAIVAGLDETAIRKHQADAEAELASVQNSRISLSEDLKAVADIQQRIMSAKLKMGEIRTSENAKVKAARYASAKAYDDAMSEVRNLTAKYNRTLDALKVIREGIAEDEASIETAKDQYRQIRTRALPEDMTICPTCGKPFDGEQLEKVKADFDARKARDLDRMNVVGKKLRSQIDTAKENAVKYEAEIKALRAEIDAKMDHAETLKKMEEAVPETVNMDEVPEYVALQKTIAECEAKLASMDNGEARKAELDAREAAVKARLRDIEADLATLSANDRVKERIEKLREEQMECSQKAADQEQILYLLDEFIKAKMDLLSERINSKFKSVRFKLFETQINGAVKDTCVMQINSNGSYVDYPNANTAAQILGGLDVIDALSELYGISVPVFVDNSECLDSENTPKVNSQLVLLRVTDDPVLTVKGE